MGICVTVIAKVLILLFLYLSKQETRRGRKKHYIGKGYT